MACESGRARVGVIAPEWRFLVSRGLSREGRARHQDREDRATDDVRVTCGVTDVRVLVLWAGRQCGGSTVRPAE